MGKNPVLIIDIDGMCPRFFEELEGKNKLPILSSFMKRCQHSQLEVTTPPQSPVSWTTIATGVNLGSHGIFDFLRRNPKTYISDISLFGIKSTWYPLC